MPINSKRYKGKLFITEGRCRMIPTPFGSQVNIEGNVLADLIARQLGYPSLDNKRELNLGRVRVWIERLGR